MEFLFTALFAKGISWLHYHIRYPDKLKRIAVIRLQQEQYQAPTIVLLPVLMFLLLILVLLITAVLKGLLLV